MTAAAAHEMELATLFPAISSAPAVEVVDIATHSAEVVPGGLFLACVSRGGHGLAFLPDALRRGARAVAWEPGEKMGAPALPPSVVGLSVPGLHGQLGRVGNRFYASPSATLAVTGITGTNGKTTVAWLVSQALTRLGTPAGYMGTLGYGLGTAVRSASLTTPGCIAVHRRLREMLDAGARHVALEVSSHALDQGRVDGVTFRIAAFTNLSRDHLDYHGDLASYARAKARLFLECDARTAVINVSDDFGRDLASRLDAQTRIVTVTNGSDAVGVRATVHAERVAGEDGPGQRVRIVIAGAEATFDSALPGAFNLENLAVAAGILHAEGFDADAIASALGGCRAPPGRMELVDAAAGPCVIVDFAHTPDALRRVLEAVRPLARSRVWCVFGCGGERDAGKRPLMGAVAVAHADRVIVTDDNPRGEDPDAIIDAIRTGAGGAVEVIRDRESAIRHAIQGAARGDVVLIAGKGHEQTQTIGREVHPFSDQAVARRVLGELA